MKDTVSKVDKRFSHNEVPKVKQECTRKSFLGNVLLWDKINKVCVTLRLAQVGKQQSLLVFEML